MKRSHEPVFWALFGAGGMLSALVAPALVFVTGIALPMGWIPASGWDAAQWQDALRHPAARTALLALIPLFLFHGAHRLRHGLHDLGLPAGRWAAVAFYGTAAAASVLTGALLLRV